MANAKITAKTESTTPAANDVVWIQDAAGANDYKVQVQNLVYPPGVITARTADTAPDGTADYLLTHDASAGAIVKTLAKNVGTKPFHAEWGVAFNLADSTTYYFGSLFYNQPATNGGRRRIYVPAGKIIAVYGWIYVSGTVASGENVALSVRVNDTTDASIGNVTLDTAGGINTFSNASMSQAVSAGEFIEIKMVTPAFATNPTNVYGVCTVLIA